MCAAEFHGQASSQFESLWHNICGFMMFLCACVYSTAQVSATSQLSALTTASWNACADLQQPPLALSIGNPPLQAQNVMFEIQENTTQGMMAGSMVGTIISGMTWRPAQFPGGCSSSIMPGTVTSLPGFPISNNTPAVTASNSSNLPAPAWYLPTAAASQNQRNW